MKLKKLDIAGKGFFWIDCVKIFSSIRAGVRGVFN